jgi:C1A family cysteine protease
VSAWTGTGHAVTAWRHDRTKQIGPWVGAFLCLNHWSASWGLHGMFWLPDIYFESGNAGDAHTIRMAEV